MSQRAGWYDDPESPENLRYFDGVIWTTHTTPRTSPSAAPTSAMPRQAPASVPTQQVPQAPSAPTPGWGAAPAPPQDREYGQQYAPQPPQQGGQPGYPLAPTYGSAPGPYGAALGLKTTPDGVPLASYGQRVGAYLLDAVILAVATGLIGSYWIYQFAQWYLGWINDLVQNTEAGQQPAINQSDLTSQITGHLWPIALVSFVVTLVYNVAFLTTKGATPGKMALGIAVRLRERPGPLRLVDALRRQAIFVVNSLLGLVPLVSLLASLLGLLDLLWPLWDDKRQALHDKIARTNVVVRRRER